MRTRSWSNVAGMVVLELGCDEDGNIFDLQTEIGYGNYDLEFLKPFYRDDVSVEVAIHFISNGSYTPASIYGGTDHLGWPEECEDERQFDSAELMIEGRVDSKLSNEIGMKLFSLLGTQINLAELEDDRE